MALAEELVNLRFALRIDQRILTDAFEGTVPIDRAQVLDARRTYGGLEVAIDALGRMIDRERGELTLSMLPGLVLNQALGD